MPIISRKCALKNFRFRFSSVIILLLECLCRKISAVVSHFAVHDGGNLFTFVITGSKVIGRLVGGGGSSLALEECGREFVGVQHLYRIVFDFLSFIVIRYGYEESNILGTVAEYIRLLELL